MNQATVIHLGIVRAVRVRGEVVTYPTDPAELLSGLGVASDITYDIDMNIPQAPWVRLIDVEPVGFREPEPMRIIPCKPGTPCKIVSENNVYNVFVDELPARSPCPPTQQASADPANIT